MVFELHHDQEHEPSPSSQRVQPYHGARFKMTDRQPCNVFINHWGINTKKSFAGLLFQYMSLVDLHCFLNSKNMKPNDRLSDNIGQGIRSCKVRVAVFSPQSCESTCCLYELAPMMEMKKKVINIFYDIEPSQFCDKNNLQEPGPVAL